MSSGPSDGGDGGQSVLDVFEQWYHVPVLAVVVAVMFWIRFLPYDSFIRDGEVLFSGNDAWYHLRAVEYTVRHWPFTMPFDPWTNFSYGTSVGQFGTLYDQLVATAALLAGLGSPGETLIAKTLLVAPAVFGALTAIPTYYAGKRLGGRVGGLFGAVVLMLIPGLFLTRTVVGAADHNAVEPFFQTTAVAALLYAFAVAEREKPVWELVEAREWEALRTPLLWAAGAGVATAAYLSVWPPGVLLLGIVAFFVLLKISSDVYNERSPEPIAFATAVAMGVTAILMVFQVETLVFRAVDFSLLQPAFALIVGVGAVFLAWLTRQWEARDVPLPYYPWAVFGLFVVGLGATAVFLPPLFSQIQGNFYRILGFSTEAVTRTISEAQPFLSESIRGGLTPTEQIVSQYGFTMFSAMAAVVWLLGKPLVDRGDRDSLAFLGVGLSVVGVVFAFPGLLAAVGGALGLRGQVFGLFVIVAIIAVAVHLVPHDAVDLFVVVWALFITSAAFTQLRFNYYLAVVVAVLNAYLLGEVIDYLSPAADAATSAIEGIETYQLVTLAAVVMLVLAPVLVVPLQLGGQGGQPGQAGQTTNTAWETAESRGPGAITEWEEPLTWMRTQTPKQGTYGGADNAGEMDYYGRYEQRDNFDYPAGAYGVMAWWDYGHWITLRGKRVPVANPFQENAGNAADFLLAPNETSAENAVETVSENDSEVRYVMVDWQMVEPTSKFAAPIVFYDRASQDAFYGPVYVSNGQRIQTVFNVRNQRYYESMAVRLYSYHGSAMEPRPIVVDWEERRVQTRDGGERTIRVATRTEQRTPLRQFSNMSRAREFVEEDGSAQIGGIGAYPAERVPALEHYRLVKVSESDANRSIQYQRAARRTFFSTGVPPSSQTINRPSWVKVFERVPGATITGDGLPANVSVRASVEMRVPTTGETFTYRQETRTNENGEFSMTLPYATTGYDEYGPENGYTNVSVRATSQYTVETPIVRENNTLTQYQTTVDISEGRVNGDVSGNRSVELERTNPFQNLSLGDTRTDEIPVEGDGATADGGDTTSSGRPPAARTASVSSPFAPLRD